MLAKRMLQCDDSPKGLAQCRYLVFIIGTPVDEHLNPSFTGMKRAIDACLPYLHDGQTSSCAARFFRASAISRSGTSMTGA